MYLHRPWPADAFEPEHVAAFAAIVEAPETGPLVFHCRTASRVGVMWAVYRQAHCGWARDQVLRQATTTMPSTSSTSAPWPRRWRASAGGVQLHLAEIKGPVMDGLRRTDFLDALGLEHVHFTTDGAMRALRCH